MRRLFRFVLPVGLFAMLTFAVPAGADHGSADEASPNMLHVANLPPPPQFLTGPPNEQRFNSDLAFWQAGAIPDPFPHDILAQGNYDGFRLVDISDPENPVQVSVVECRANQGDVSFYQANDRLLLIQSIDRPVTDDDCATARDTPVQTGTNPVTGLPGVFFGPGFEGLRIFDVTNPTAPVHIASADTACGSHTHTTIVDEKDQQAVVYVSSYPLGGSVTPVGEAPGPRCNPPHAKISIVTIPDSSPETPTVKEQPLHADTLPFTGSFGSGGSLAIGCHDITAFYDQQAVPAANQNAKQHFEIAGAACLEEGQLWDISDPENPTTLTTHSHIRNPFITAGVPGTFRGLFHTASFSNDGEVTLFTDEWAGGGGHGCDGPQDTRGNVWFYKTVTPGVEPVPLYGRFITPRPQPAHEACTMHNGNVITVSDESDGDFGVSSAYQAGTSVFDFTGVQNFPEIFLPPPPASPPVPPIVAREVAFFDAKNDPAGPTGIDDAWSSYWYNDYVYASSGLTNASPTRPGARGLDVYLLLGRNGRLVDRDGQPVTNPNAPGVHQFTGRDVRYMNPQTQDTFQNTSHGQ
jgi:hypothetical protein